MWKVWPSGLLACGWTAAAEEQQDAGAEQQHAQDDDRHQEPELKNIKRDVIFLLYV